MQRRTLAAMALVIGLAPLAAMAQGAYSKKAVKFIAPYAVGDLPDTVAPVVAQCMTDRRGQAAVVNNKSGGNGVVACQALLKSNPSDGHAFIVSDGSMLSTHRRSTRPSKDC